MWTSKSLVIGQAYLDTVIAAQTAVPAAALLHLPKMRLSADPAFNPVPTNVPADLAAGEATFPGYPAGGVAVTPSAAVNLPNGSQGLLMHALFIATGPVVAGQVQITGYWIDDGTNIILSERFPPGSAITIALAGDFADIESILPFLTSLQTGY